MRNIFIRIAVCVITAIISFSVSASEREWKDAPGGLPYYMYTGSQDDATFLLGNPGMWGPLLLPAGSVHLSQIGGHVTMPTPPHLPPPP